MEPADVWGARWDACDNSLARLYMEVTCRKQSLVVLAADLNTMDGLNDLVDRVGPHIAALKTHVDLVDDWTATGWAAFCEKAKSHDLLIFEDQKFGDIGPISRGQISSRPTASPGPTSSMVYVRGGLMLDERVVFFFSHKCRVVEICLGCLDTQMRWSVQACLIRASLGSSAMEAGRLNLVNYERRWVTGNSSGPRA